MQFVDDQVAHCACRLRHFSPVKDIPDYTCVVSAQLPIPPEPLTGNGPCIRIQQDGIAVKDQSVFRFIGAVNLIGIFKFLNIKSKHNHRIDIPDFIGIGKGKPGIGLYGIPVKKKESTGGSVMGVNRKIYAYRQHHGAMYIKQPGPYRKSFNFCHWGQ